MNEYEKAYPEKNKNACQNAVAEIWKNMKKDYPSFDELRKEVDRKANEWKELSITKKSRMTDFWPGVRKKVPMWQSNCPQPQVKNQQGGGGVKGFVT